MTIPAHEFGLSGARDYPVAPGPSFALGLWRIAAADVSSGNRVTLLRDGPATFDAMLGLIDAATTSVALESYIFRSDEVGHRIGDALIRAVERGVAVRLLLDWIGARGTSRKFLRELRDARRRGRRLQPARLPPLARPRSARPPQAARRRRQRSASPAASASAANGRPACRRLHRSRWRDTAVKIEGPAAHDMVQAFDRMWHRTIGSERRGSHRFLRRKARGAHLDPATDEPALVGIIEGEPLRLRVSRALQIQAISAKRSIWIATAYFTPSPSEIEALNGAARDGVDVRILVPSRNDHPWVSLLARRFYRRLLTNGVRIWEWQGEMMHAKTERRRRPLGSRRLDGLQSARRRDQLRARCRHRRQDARRRRRANVPRRSRGIA